MITPNYPESVIRRFGVGRENSVASDDPPDDLTDKLTKYIPAPAIAFFLPTYQALGDTVERSRNIFVIGLVGTLLYLVIAHVAEKKATAIYFFILGLVAFAVWAIGTSDVGGKLFGLSQQDSRIILAAAIFLIPGIDVLITRAIEKFFP
jgi:hypothetical protein